MSEKPTAFHWLRGLAGCVLGGALGYFLFFLFARQGFYALVMPGALLGLGCAYLSGIKSDALGALCGVLALLLSLYIEWRFFPFRDDSSFNFFITNVHNLRAMTLLMIGLGTFAGYWFGKGR